jgi:hypothetical protein
LGATFPSHYVADKLPQPYRADKTQVKAIVLGTDPTNPQQKRFEHVFGIGSDARYFKGIGNNLHLVGLSLTQVYVLNLCRNYFRDVTARNAQWYTVAAHWLSLLKNELDDLFDKRVPVLITAWSLFEVLAKRPSEFSSSVFYEKAVFLAASENHLDRTVVPLFRHYKYSLKRERWSQYRGAVGNLFRKSCA